MKDRDGYGDRDRAGVGAKGCAWGDVEMWRKGERETVR